MFYIDRALAAEGIGVSATSAIPAALGKRTKFQCPVGHWRFRHKLTENKPVKPD